MKLFWQELLKFLLNKVEETLPEVALQEDLVVEAVDTHKEVVEVKDLAHNMELLNKVEVEALGDILKEVVEAEAQEAILKEVVEVEAQEDIPKEVVVKAHLAHTVLLNKEAEVVALVDILRVDEVVVVVAAAVMLNLASLKRLVLLEVSLKKEVHQEEVEVAEAVDNLMELLHHLVVAAVHPNLLEGVDIRKHMLVYEYRVSLWSFTAAILPLLPLCIVGTLSSTSSHKSV